MQKLLLALLCLTLTATVVSAEKQVLPAGEPGVKALAVRLDVPEFEPNDTCEDASLFGNIIALGDIYTSAFDVEGDLDYYEVFPTADGNYLLETFPVDGSPITDTVITLVGEDCATVIAEDDDGGPGLFSKLNVYLEAGTVYYLLVNEYGNNAAGAYYLSMNVPPPPADACDDVMDPVCNAVVGGDITGATDHINEFNGNCIFNYNSFGPDHWYNLTVPPGQGFSYELTSFDFGGDALVLFVVEGCEETSWICHERVWVPSDDLNTIAYTNGGAEDITVHLVISGYYETTVGTYEGVLSCDAGVIKNEDLSFGDLKSQFR